MTDATYPRTRTLVYIGQRLDAKGVLRPFYYDPATGERPGFMKPLTKYPVAVGVAIAVEETSPGSYRVGDAGGTWTRDEAMVAGWQAEHDAAGVTKRRATAAKNATNEMDRALDVLRSAYDATTPSQRSAFLAHVLYKIGGR